MISSQWLLKATWLPILGLLLWTPWSASMDQTVARHFYQENHFASSPLLTFVYNYGFYPAWLLAICSAISWLCSFKFSFAKQWRLPAFYLVVTLAIGSGLFIHALLKDHWGRPRPKLVDEFGGQQPFRAYYQPNFFHQPQPSKSFPCGHCSTGFYFFALAILGKHYHNRRVYLLGMIIALGLGGLLSYTRIAQGGHFLSDIVVSALVMWLTAVGFYWLMFKFYNKVKDERIDSKAT